MSQGSYGSDSERHREMAKATEKHKKKASAHHSGASSGSGGSADAHERAEETYFVRHRSKFAAAFLIVLITIFFVTILGWIRF